MNNVPNQQPQSSAEAAGSMQRALNWVRDNNCASSVKAIHPGPEPLIEFRSTEALVRVLQQHDSTGSFFSGPEECLMNARIGNIHFLARDKPPADAK